jgi:DNA-binding Xre family transcriptional regulator
MKGGYMDGVVKQEVRVDADRLDAMLKRRGMSLRALAQTMGMHYNSLLRIKAEGGTNLGTVSEMCTVLQCHPFDLLVAEGYPEPFSHAPASH